MRRFLPLLVFLAFLAFPIHAHAAAGYCSVHAKAASANTNSVTTTGVDTTGCTELVVYCSSGSATQVVTDSKSNSWTAKGPYADSATDSRIGAFYAENPMVGSSHTFTCTSTSAFPSMCMIGLNGTGTSATFRTENHGATSGSAMSASTGAVSPQTTDIVTAAISLNATSGTVNFDSSFTKLDQQDYMGATNYGIACGYKTTPSGTENLGLSWTNNINAAATIDVFEAAGSTIVNSVQKYLLITQ